jgi:hypothetical protein
MELMMGKVCCVGFFPAIGVIFGVMDPESLTAPAVPGKEEKSLYEESRRVSADFVKNFTSGQKALATTHPIDFDFPFKFSSFSDDSHGSFSFLHRQRGTRGRDAGVPQQILSGMVH